ncbi:hypothetical protein V492_00239 [Pseudogymnoascus sp. VKM F-4246]|nr:hypothetical protein V492_00239 [Pseudogymnoascus sp. VKM F-4246]
MAASTQISSMASSFPTGEGNMTDAQFSEWCAKLCTEESFTPMYDNFDEMNLEMNLEMNFENAMLHVTPRDITWSDEWTDWPHFGDTPEPKHCGEELSDFPPVAINLSQDLAAEIVPGLVRDRVGSSVFASSEESESTEEPKSTGEPESLEEQDLPEKSESPEGSYSPDGPESPEGSNSPEKSQSPEEPESPQSPEGSQSPEEPESPQSPEEPESPEGSHSPEGSQSPEGSESPDEETAPGLVHDKEFDAGDKHKTVNLLDLRTKLQKGLLTKKGRKECEMSDMLSLLRQLDLHFEHEFVAYKDGLEYISREDVRAPKIGVLLRAIKNQEGVPSVFKGRAASLLVTWKCIRKRRAKPAVKSVLQRKVGPTAPLMVNPTESCEFSTNPETPSFQESDNGNDGVAVNQTSNIVGIGRTESCKLVAISETPSSQAMVDCNQGSRSASLATNDDKPVIKSVTAEENPTSRDVPSPNRGKRKCPASERSASELQPLRRSDRQQEMTSLTVTQYITGETRFVRDSLSKIDDLIWDIESGKETDGTSIIGTLLGLKSDLVRFGALHDQADREWSSDQADNEWSR